MVSVTSLQVPNFPGVQSVREEQLADSTLLRAKEADQKPSLDEVCMSRATHRLLQIWDQITVHEGILCRCFEAPNGRCLAIQILIPQRLRAEVLTGFHEGPMGGDLGMDKTLARLQERFYWPGYHDDVWNFCADCAAHKNPATKPRAPLMNVKTGYPLQLVAMDIPGPFPESDLGNRYILVVADYFTRWTEACAIKNQEATTVAKKATDEFFFRFSPLEQLHTNQGRNFESELIAKICKLLNVQKLRTTPYHPQSNGLVERCNQTLLSMLAIAASSQPF